MTSHIIATPGDGPRADDCPEVEIAGGGETPLTVTVTFFSGRNRSQLPRAEVAFLDVLEFRWFEWEVIYETHPQHEDDFDFDLIEIVDSAYVQAMMDGATGAQTERSARHFRISFDDWGELNVIARAIRVRALDNGPAPATPQG